MIDVPIQVKDALREGRLRKNYRFQVLNDDGTVDFTIDNNNLVSESVNIDERMCSGDQIKYGLCEGSSLEFQYFDKENITGRQLKVFVDVEYEDESAYTYTDVEEFPRFDPVTITTPGHYKVYSAVEGVSFEIYLTRGSKTKSFESVATEDGAEIVLGELKSGDTLELTWGSMFWTAPMLQVGTAVPYAIPMGYFTVKNCSRQASTGIIKAVCYNKLQSQYLDSDVTEDVKTIVANGEAGRPTGGVSNYYLLNQLLEGYEIDNRPPTEDNLGYTNREGNSEVGFGIYDGDSDIHDEEIAFMLTKQHYSITEDKGFFVIQRKLVASGMNEVDSDYKVVAQHLFPQGYHSITINPQIAEKVRDGITSFFSQFQDDEVNHDYYYVQPVYMSDAGAIYYRGDNIRLKDLVASLDSDTENLYPAIPSLDSATAGNLTHISNAFKGMIAWYYLNEPIGSEIHFKIEKEYTTSLEYNHYNFLTPKNRSESDLFYINSTYGYYSNQVNLIIPSAIYYSDSYDDWYNYHVDNFHRVYEFPWYQNGYDFQLRSYFRDDISSLENYVLTTSMVENLPKVTLRELQSAVYEAICQFGQLSRETDLFSGVELNRSRLLPADTLYPDNTLYPDGAQESAFRSQYSKLWADEGNVRKWRYLIITYKGLNGDNQEEDFTLQRTVNADGTDDYNCSDNWLFRNLVWTAEQIGEYADAMVAKMQDITWFPFEMWCAGLPYLETGDEIEIPLGEDTYTSYILQRQLKGIQNLQDTYINGTLDIF